MAARKNNTELDRDTACYLATGESNPCANAYPSNDLFERLTGQKAHLRRAMIKEIGHREKAHWLPSPPDPNLPSST